MRENILSLSPGWVQLKDKFSLKNDQGMSFLCNYKAPCGEIATLFLVNEEVSVGLNMFDRMITDYKQTTSNLQMLLKSKVKIRDKHAYVYIIREKISKKAMVQLFFEKKNTLYALIFNLEKYEPSTKKCIEGNKIFSQVISLLEVQE